MCQCPGEYALYDSMILLYAEIRRRTCLLDPKVCEIGLMSEGEVLVPRKGGCLTH